MVFHTCMQQSALYNGLTKSIFLEKDFLYKHCSGGVIEGWMPFIKPELATVRYWYPTAAYAFFFQYSFIESEIWFQL